MTINSQIMKQIPLILLLFILPELLHTVGFDRENLFFNEEVLDFHGLLPMQIAEKISKCFKKA